MIKVLIVEDSPVIQQLLNYILDSDPDIQVVGTAGNGEEVLEMLQHKKSDVITMDIHMPRMDGFEATRRIMETRPTPIIIVSGSSSAREAATAFRAMEAGALTVVSRPRGIGHPDYENSAKDLIQTVKLMSEVKVVRRWPRRNKESARPTPVPNARITSNEIKVVAIGASTGGPLAIQAVLSGLPKVFPVPILIVQHIAPGFVEGFVEWLSQTTGFPVHLASEGEFPLPGHAYVAPDGFHMQVKSGGRISLSQDQPWHGLRPSVSILFRSVADNFARNAVGVLLSGMGKDGAEELKLMKDNGAVTIIQDKNSSVVFGMAGEALKAGAATYILALDKIASMLVQLVSKLPIDK